MTNNTHKWEKDLGWEHEFDKAFKGQTVNVGDEKSGFSKMFIPQGIKDQYKIFTQKVHDEAYERGYEKES